MAPTVDAASIPPRQVSPIAVHVPRLARFSIELSAMDADGGEVRPESVFELARRVDPRLLGHRQLGDGGEAAIRRWQTHEVG